MATEPEKRVRIPRWGFRSALRWTSGTAAFATWLAMLIFGGTGAEWDNLLLREFHAGANSVLARNAGFLTFLGSWKMLIPLTLGAALLLAFTRRIRAALLLVMIFGGRALVELQKVLVDRDRPGADPFREALHSMSFPSGHAANAMITYFGIALLVPVSFKKRAIAVGIGLALALQVGWSRLALGLNWPSDVLGAWAFAAFWIIVCMRLASARPESEPATRPNWRRNFNRTKPMFSRRKRQAAMDQEQSNLLRFRDRNSLNP